jgi:hypothetical protein
MCQRRRLARTSQHQVLMAEVEAIQLQARRLFKPHFAPSNEIRFLNEFFRYVLEDLHTCGAAGASPPARKTAPVPSDDEGAAKLMMPELGATNGNQVPLLTLNFKLKTLPTPGRE